MSNTDLAVGTTTQSRDEELWGRANDRRGIAYTGNGVSYVEYATDFVRQFPIGTTLSTQQFDEWLQGRGLLRIPLPNVSKNSDAWLGHLQRRHQHREKINKAATHPRMWGRGSTPFIVAAYAGGYEVQAPHAAAARSHAVDRIASLTVTKRRELAYLMQSADFTQLPPHERMRAEEVFQAIEEFAEDTKIGVERLHNKFSRLASRLRSSMDRGEMQSVDGSLKRLVDQRSDEDELES